ncbi:MAG: hypothetical protein ACTSPQ_17700, partial [Candidatus Helarchaeota archaeon]
MTDTIANLIPGNGGNILLKNNYSGGNGGNCEFKLKLNASNSFKDSVFDIRWGSGGLSPSSVGKNGSIDLNLTIMISAKINLSKCFINGIEDIDRDGLTNINEMFFYLTSVFLNDTDDDNMPDGWEIKYLLDPLDNTDNITDLDNDLLLNVYEFEHATDPRDPDSDNDLLNDGAEVWIYQTNPNLKDTDGDGIIDGYEVLIYGSNPNMKDTDMDGLNDWIDPVKTFPISTLTKNLDELILFEAVDFSKLSNEEFYNRIEFYTDFIGLNQLDKRITTIEKEFNNKIDELTKKYEQLKFLVEYSKRIKSIRTKINYIYKELENFRGILIEKLKNFSYNSSNVKKIEFKIEEFHDQLSEIIKIWNEKFTEFSRLFDNLLENKKIEKINKYLIELEDLFLKTDKWMENANLW